MMAGYVVFGASGGVGTTLTQRLRSRGADVVAAGRAPEKIELLAQATGSIPMVADATDAGQVEGLIAESAEALGGIAGIVNCVAPGMVDTPATSRITTSERALKTSTAMHALGRIGKPDDVASMIEWLLAPTNDWVTGQVFGVDGGLGTLRTRGT